MRKFIAPIVVLVLLLAGFIFWRATHPKLTDEQQIAANLDGICAAANERSPRGVANFLAKDFKAGQMGKSDFQNSLAGGILQYRVINLTLPSATSKVTGDTATSQGHFNLSLKSEYNSPAEVQQGPFTLHWRKTGGQWLIVSADIESPLLH